MKIVIDIQDNYYERLANDFNNVTDSVSIGVKDILYSVKNGIPLPKGYGDLIDRSDLLEYTDISISAYTPTISRYNIVTAPTIIPADKEG